MGSTDRVSGRVWLISLGGRALQKYTTNSHKAEENTQTSATVYSFINLFISNQLKTEYIYFIRASIQKKTTPVSRKLLFVRYPNHGLTLHRKRYAIWLDSRLR